MSQRDREWEVVQYDAMSRMSMRMAVRSMPVAWMISRRDKYDVDADGGEEDADSVDDSK